MRIMIKGSFEGMSGFWWVEEETSNTFRLRKVGGWLHRKVIVTEQQLIAAWGE